MATADHKLNSQTAKALAPRGGTLVAAVARGMLGATERGPRVDGLTLASVLTGRVSPMARRTLRRELPVVLAAARVATAAAALRGTELALASMAWAPDAAAVVGPGRARAAATVAVHVPAARRMALARVRREARAATVDARRAAKAALAARVRASLCGRRGSLGSAESCASAPLTPRPRASLGSAAAAALVVSLASAGAMAPGAKAPTRDAIPVARANTRAAAIGRAKRV
jgi:hypothetical protein